MCQNSKSRYSGRARISSLAVSVTDEAIRTALEEVASVEGLLLCPEGAATYAAYKTALADGRVKPGERAILFNCATGLKYPMPKVEAWLDKDNLPDLTTL